MKLYRERDGYSWKVRVKGTERTIRASTGTSDYERAQDVANFAKSLRLNRDWRTLDAIVGKKVTLRDAYDAQRNNALPKLLEDAERIPDPDLSPLISAWLKQGANQKYVIQVRRLIPDGKYFPSGEFRRGRISAFLAGLDVSGSTKRRYRTALSQFAKWLVEREVIESNPVRDVKAAKENPARMVWLTVDQQKQLIDALPEPYKALEALMAGTGLEWGAIASMKRKDVDESTRKIHAKGGKTKYRNRVVRVTEDWTWPIIRAHIKTLTPNAPLFTLNHFVALDVHQEANKAAGLPASTLHDWRHSYAVNWLKDRGSPQVLKRQLGHAPNSTVVERVYGVWIVDDSDYQKTPKAAPRLKRIIANAR